MTWTIVPADVRALEKGDLQELRPPGAQAQRNRCPPGGRAGEGAALPVEHFMLHAGDQAEAEKAVSTLVRECEVLRRH